MIFPGTCTTIFTLFRCETFDTGEGSEEYLVADLSIKCSEGQTEYTDHYAFWQMYAGFMMIIKAMRRAEALEQQLQLLGTERLTVADEKEDA